MDISIKYHARKWLAASVLFLFCVLSLTVQANSSNPTPKLSKSQGFLLLDLQVDAPSAVMTLQREGYKPIDVKLIPSNGRWLVKALPKGEYQITEIKVPYFDLPYRKYTEKNPGWRIRIQAGQLNYAGRIEVAKERTEDYVDIKKLNRLITDLPSIQNELAFILVAYPLADGGYLRDDFAAASLEVETNHE